MKTRVFRLKDVDETNAAIREAARTILEGGTVVFPTETVYGLGANAFDEEAVGRIFKLKGRPPDNPLILHIASIGQLHEVVTDLPVDEDTFVKMVERLWPGPVTFVLPRNRNVPSIATGGLDTVGVRMPAHPVALKLIERAGVPVAAPSANLSGRPSPTDEEHVLEDMNGRADVILLNGKTPLGVESTVVDLTHFPPRLLRPGPVDPERLRELLGIEIEVDKTARGMVVDKRPRSPGMKYRHYAPSKPLILLEGSEEFVLDNMRRLTATHSAAVICSAEVARALETNENVLAWGKRNDLFAAAKRLFELMRKAERLPVEVILAEGVEEKGIGLAVANRLRRAADEILMEREK